jgi:hypothetical protein
VTDALDDPVRAFARELLGIRGAVRGRRNAIGIPIKGDRRHRDGRTFGKSLFQIVVVWVAFSQAQPPAVISRWREMRACNNNTCGESKGQNSHDSLLALPFLIVAIDRKASIY